MAYKFPLAAVLRVKESMERLEELALQKIIVEMSQVQHQIDSLNDDIARSRKSLEVSMQQFLPAAHIELMMNPINLAAHRKEELLALLAELNHKRETQTRKYQAAHRNTRALSDLKTRLQDAHEQERARAEQKFIDEIFGARAQRANYPNAN